MFEVKTKVVKIIEVYEDGKQIDSKIVGMDEENIEKIGNDMIEEYLAYQESLKRSVTFVYGEQEISKFQWNILEPCYDEFYDFVKDMMTNIYKKNGNIDICFKMNEKTCEILRKERILPLYKKDWIEYRGIPVEIDDAVEDDTIKMLKIRYIS